LAVLEPRSCGETQPNPTGCCRGDLNIAYRLSCLLGRGAVPRQNIASPSNTTSVSHRPWRRPSPRHRGRLHLIASSVFSSATSFLRHPPTGSTCRTSTDLSPPSPSPFSSLTRHQTDGQMRISISVPPAWKWAPIWYGLRQRDLALNRLIPGSSLVFSRKRARSCPQRIPRLHRCGVPGRKELPYSSRSQV